MALTQLAVGTAIQNIPNNLRSSEVWISGTSYPLSYSGQTSQSSYRSVFFRNTNQSFVVEQQGNGQLNWNNVIASYDPNTQRWNPTAYAQTLGGNSLVNSITRNQSLSANFNNATDATIRSGNSQATGSNLTAAQVQNIRNAGTTPPSGVPTATGSRPPAGASPTPTPRSSPTIVDPTAKQTNDAFGNSLDIIAKTNQDIKQEKGGKLEATKKQLKYPKDFPTNMDAIEFSALEYGTKTYSSNTFGFSSRKNTSTGDTVTLPFQTGISDANTVGWNEETFNPAAVVGSQLAISGVANGPSGFVGQIQQLMGTAKNNSTEIERAIIAYFTQQAVGVQVLPKLSGAVFNPNTELLFQGPQLRSFNFTFKLTPRNKDESDEVKQIINFFKRNMAAQTTDSEIYLKAPNVFKITYYHSGSKDHSGINLIKECALQACNVEYTPDGSYMTFEDGGMVSYSLNLQFMELEPIYARDYNNQSHPIGY
jgi:Tail-tube assembly protein